jgi:hypothetical protein
MPNDLYTGYLEFRDLDVVLGTHVYKVAVKGAATNRPSEDATFWIRALVSGPVGNYFEHRSGFARSVSAAP